MAVTYAGLPVTTIRGVKGLHWALVPRRPSPPKVRFFTDWHGDVFKETITRDSEGNRFSRIEALNPFVVGPPCVGTPAHSHSED
jgi:hypothetical protein